MGRLFFSVYAILAYILFLIAFLYAIGFVGNLLVPKSIDSGQEQTLLTALVINCSLLTLFAVQHSLMARPAFKRWWTKVIPQPIERSTYVLLSSLILLLLYWQWVPLKTIVWHIEEPIASGLIWGLFVIGWLIVLLSTFMINHFDLFGLRQVWLHWRKKDYTDVPFVRFGFYNFVRHPLMLGFIIAFWATPVMTMGHLLFSVMVTAYILVALQLEERDLVRHIGDGYRQYQQEVPMLIPTGNKVHPPVVKKPAI